MEKLYHKDKLSVKDPRAFVYLDNHATTPLDPIVLEAMMPYFEYNFGNPSSNHFLGAKAKDAVDQAREEVALAINANPEEIIFTGGATEANNTVIKCLFEASHKLSPHFIVTEIEHKCVLNAVKHIIKMGATATYLKVGANGMIDLEQLRESIMSKTRLVSMMFANNEIGSINPIKKSVLLAHQQEQTLFHTDAAQAVGKLNIDVKDLGIDFLSASAHKFYGPKGVGFLYIRKEIQSIISPLMDGGGQEFGLRSGSLNVAGIVGLGQAIKLACANLRVEQARVSELRDLLYNKLITAIPSIILNGPPLDSKDRLPNNLNVTIPGLDTAKLKTLLPLIAFSSSSACNSTCNEPSYVLKAIGRSDEEAFSSIRFGLGRFNSYKEIEKVADKFISAIKKAT